MTTSADRFIPPMGGAVGPSPEHDSFSPLTTAVTQAYLLEKAKDYMVATYGPVAEADDKDAWFTRYGLLVAFCHEVCPK